MNLDLPSLRKAVRKPLQPFWITPDSLSIEMIFPTPNHSKVICCTASRFIDCPEASDGKYVQGASDDSESWAHGLTPTLFWEHSEQLFATTEDELPALIKNLLDGQKESKTTEEAAVLIRPTSTIYIGPTSISSQGSFDGIIMCSDTTNPVESPEEGTEKAGTLLLNCGVGKLGSRALRTQLSRVPPFIEGLKARISNPTILFACTTGKDLSAGVALAVLCLFFDKDGKQRCYTTCHHREADVGLLGAYIGDEPRQSIDKTFIRQRLTWLSSSKSDVNPSRSTLQAVNLFLMPRS